MPVMDLVEPIAFVLLLVVLLLLLSHFLGARATARSRGPPGPEPFLFLGNTHEVMTNLPRLLDWTWECNKRYGGAKELGTWSFKVLGHGGAFVMTNDPVNLERVLGKVEIYGKGPVFKRNLWRLFGDGIFNVDGTDWHFQRKTASNMFKVSNFKGVMHRAIRSKCIKLLDILAKPHGGDGIAISDLYFRFTLDSIGEIAFGQDLASLSGQNKEFMEAFDFCQRFANDLFFLPAMPLLYMLLLPSGWEFLCKSRLLDSVVRGIIRTALEAKADERGDVDEPRDENLLMLFMEKGQQQDRRCDENYLKDVMLNAMVAGRDTTGQALTWMTYLLAQHPDIQDKVYEEARAVLGDLPLSDITYDHVQKLTYTHAVMMETLRLYPSVPKEIKWCYKDDVLPDGTKLCKGDWVLFSPYVMGRSESLWPNALDFNPDRFLGSGSKPSSFVFTAFQAGPRICLGMNLAYQEGKLVIASIIRDYHITLVPGQRVEPVQNSLTLPIKDPLRVTLHKRDDN